MSNADRLHDIIYESVWVQDGVPMPSIIELSLTDYCNLKCPICPHADPKYPNNLVFMPTSVIDRIIVGLKNMRFGGLISLSGYGEPTFHPQMIEFVQKLSKICMVDIVTNGTTLNSWMLSKLLLSGINKILVSAYSEKVALDMTDLFKDVSPNKYEIRPRYIKNFKVTNRGGCMKGHGNRNPCWYLAYSMMIDYNGDVMLCPQDFSRDVRYGNVMGLDLKEIWTSHEMTKRRFELFDGRHKIRPCTKCNVVGTEQGEEHVRLWNLYKSTTPSTTAVML